MRPSKCKSVSGLRTELSLRQLTILVHVQHIEDQVRRVLLAHLLLALDGLRRHLLLPLLQLHGLRDGPQRHWQLLLCVHDAQVHLVG